MRMDWPVWGRWEGFGKEARGGGLKAFKALKRTGRRVEVARLEFN